MQMKQDSDDSSEEEEGGDGGRSSGGSDDEGEGGGNRGGTQDIHDKAKRGRKRTVGDDYDHMDDWIDDSGALGMGAARASSLRLVPPPLT